jgi:DNA invertase Pin-like site-specific DNA recombinase
MTSGKKHSGKFVSYIRVSTAKQGESKNGLEAQRVAIAKFLNGGRWELLTEFQEIESGRKNNRPALSEALTLCIKENATLVIAKLDRLSRSVSFVAKLIESDVNFVCCDNEHATPLMLHMLSAFAEHEAKLIGRRIRESLAIVKAKGVKLGNPNMEEFHWQGQVAIQARANSFADKHKEDMQNLKEKGFTLQMIADKYNLADVPTSRGKKWYATSVSNLLKR